MLRNTQDVVAVYGLSSRIEAAYCSAVEHEKEWSARVAALVGQRVEHFRTNRKGGRLTAKDLADRCAAEGLPLDRAVIAKLEKGIRQSVSVAEVIVLGKALGVPPIELIFPIGHDELCEVLPGREMGSWQAAKWFSGEGPFLHRTEDGWLPTSQEHDDWQESATYYYRWHDIYMKQCLDALSAAKAARKAAGVAATEGEQLAHLRHAKAEEAQYRVCRKLLREHRAAMRRRGITPPDLWGDAFEDIDTPDPDEERS